MTGIRTVSALLLAASAAATACASAGGVRDPVPDEEYRVYAAMLQVLRASRTGTVVVDQTIPLPCPAGDCLGEVAAEEWPELWADFVRNNQTVSILRADRFPRGFRVRLASEVPRPAINCDAHGWIALSRAGFNADSTLAMIHWYKDIHVGPTRGCEQRYGLLNVLRRQADGGWEQIHPRYLHPEGISPLPPPVPNPGS